MKNIQRMSKFQKLEQLKILIVEDEFLLAEHTKTLLAEEGFRQASMALDYEEALVEIKNFVPDIVLLDIQLGNHYKGLELAKKLRYEFKIPFVFTSSHHNEAMLVEAQKYQPDGYLVKPLQRDSLRIGLEMAMYKSAYKNASQQDRDKTLLLDLSNTFASIRDKKELFNTLFENLKPQFGFDDAVINLWEVEGKFLRVFTTDQQAEAPFDPNYRKLIGKSLPTKGTPYENLWPLDRPILLDLKKQFELYPEFPGLQLTHNLGYMENLVIPLSYHGKTLGVFELLSKKQGHLQTLEWKLLEAVANQIAITVSNILANEEILESQREKEILLSISEDIANIRDREDLYKVVMKKLKNFIDFDDAVILVKNKDGAKFNLFLNLADEDRKAHPQFKEITNRDLPIPGSPIELFFQKGHLFEWKAEEMIQLYPGYPGMVLQIDTGLHYSFNLALKAGAETFGLLIFHFKKPYQIDPNRTQLYKSICDQFSVAVSNIIANEEILERQKEKETLLRISEYITKLRDWNDLFEVAFQELKSVLHFEDAVITIPSDIDRNLMKIFITDADKKYKGNPHYDMLTTAPYEMPPHFRTIYELRAPQLFSVEEYEHLSPDFPGVQLMQEIGLKATWACPLRYGAEVIASLELHYKSRESAEAINFTLVNNVANQLSTAVANILANEEILQRQQEKEELRNFSEDIAAVRNRRDLFNLISRKVRKYVPFDDAILITLVEGTTTYRNFLDMANEERALDPAYRRLMDTPVSYEQPAINDVINKEDFELIVVDEELKKHPDFIGHKMMKENGLDYSCKFDLKSTGKRIGTIFFHFKEYHQIDENKKPFLSNIINQISIAVSNILANEEILQRQQEKESLLAISEGIALIKNRQDLYQLISEKVKPHVPFDAVVLVTIDRKDKVYRIFLDQTDAQNTENPVYRRLMSTLVSTEDPATKAFFRKEDFTLVSVDEEIERFPDFIGHRLMKENGFNYSYKFSLKSSGKTYGVGAFHFREKYQIEKNTIPFLSNVISQISVAVSNIISNEEIVFREKIKSLQATIAQAITSGKDWPRRFESIMTALKEAFPFDYISLAIDTEGAYAQGCAFERIGFNEYRLMEADQFFERSGMSLEVYEASRRQNAYHRPEIWNVADFERIRQKDPIKEALARIFKLQSNLNVPLNLSKKGQFQISLYSKMENAYTDQHLELVEQLLPALIHPLEKVVAYDQIEKLNVLLQQEKEYLQEEIRVNHNFEEIIGSTKTLQDVFEKISQVANADTTVLITGETGTGKELVARAIHNSSKRKHKPLVKLNCATLPAELLESELFGHEKGSFTGAANRRIGKFELAHTGTIFLDEIGEMPVKLQSKLLRVIQEKEFERLGGNKVIRTDVRIIAATNRNLEAEVSQGQFRSDLFFRLNVFPIHLPALRERKEDIPALILHFLQKSNKKLGKKITGISNSSFQQLMGYEWPGNIRELEHLVERAVLLNKGPKLDLTVDKKGFGVPKGALDPSIFRPQKMEDAEREVILNTLRYSGGKVRGKGGAAELLGMHPSTLDSRMKKLGIGRKHVLKDHSKEDS